MNVVAHVVVALTAFAGLASAAGTTPNNYTDAGAMFGNKYQGDVSAFDTCCFDRER